MERKEYLHIRSHLNFVPKAGPLVVALLIQTGLILFVAWGAHVLPSVLEFFMAPLVTILMARSFSLMHEASHGLLTKNRSLNSALGVFFGAFCLLPFEPWRKSHMEHHYWSGNIQKDPVMGFLLVYPKLSGSFRNFLDFFWLRWIPVLALIQNTVFWILSLRVFVKDPKTVVSLFSLLGPVLLVALVGRYGSGGFIGWAILPGVIGYLLTNEVINLPHHLQTDQILGEEHLPAWKQFAIARSCHYPRVISRWLVLNFNLHVEHHMFPDLPWYQLDRVTPILGIHLKEDYRKDPQFRWILTNRPQSLQNVLFGEPKAQTNPMDKAS